MSTTPTFWASETTGAVAQCWCVRAMHTPSTAVWTVRAEPSAYRRMRCRTVPSCSLSSAPLAPLAVQLLWLCISPTANGGVVATLGRGACESRCRSFAPGRCHRGVAVSSDCTDDCPDAQRQAHVAALSGAIHMLRAGVRQVILKQWTSMDFDTSRFVGSRGCGPWHRCELLVLRRGDVYRPTKGDR